MYKFDFGKMTQTNTITDKVTKMRRRAAKAKEKHLAVGKADDEEDEKVLEEEEDETPKKKAKKNAKKDEEEEEEEETPKKKTKKTPKKDEEEEEEEEKPKAKKAKKAKWVWEWQQGKKWKAYSLADATLLEEKLNDAKLKFKSKALSFNKGQSYEFDLENDTQKNVDTGTTVKLRRRAAAEDDDITV